MVRSLKFLNQFALVALALSLSFGQAKAQSAYEGKFTLPFEAHWGIAVLPAGDYTISMQSANEPYLLYIRGEGKTAIIMANGANTKAVSDDSHLTVVNTGGNQAVTELAAGQLGLILDYPVHKSQMKPMLGAKPGAKPLTSSIIPVRDTYGPASGR
jgi:hypothetical protein